MRAIAELWAEWGGLIVALTLTALALVAAGHCILRKRDTRAAFAWTGVIIALPGLGAALYWVFGINRVQRRALALFRDHVQLYPFAVTEVDADWLKQSGVEHAAFARMMDRVSARPLLAGNSVTTLTNGDEAYPAMLAAIDAAQRSVTLTTYIFDRDAPGLLFADALGRAVARGVAVRVLIDAVGVRYSLPSILGPLRRRNVPVARFNYTLLPWRWRLANLRNHRKILVCDGRVGFTGGLNIRAGHVIADGPRHPVVDLHFQLTGPIVSQMQTTFVEDWFFVTGERLEGERWLPDPMPSGDVFARAITDGPDADFNKLRWTILGAIAHARRRVRIVTPYFLPESDLVHAMELARFRAIDVEVVIPRRNNQLLVKWACDAHLPYLMRRGVRVIKTDGVFDHTKVMVVDDDWTLIGSGNMDPRSLRLNFEFNIECYSRELARRMNADIDARIAQGAPVTMEELARRSLPVRLRDGIARLFTPYL